MSINVLSFVFFNTYYFHNYYFIRIFAENLKTINVMMKEKDNIQVSSDYEMLRKQNDGTCKVTIENKDGIILPDNLFIKELHINNCSNIVLPANLHVAGDLFIGNSNNITFDEATQIDKDLILKYCYAISVPSSVKLNGGIKVRNVQFNTFTLPLVVKGSLLIQDTNIPSLPDNLIIRDDLRIESNSIKELPLNLRVGHNVYLQHSTINRIQNGLICERLLLPDNIVTFPDEYIVTLEISGKYSTLDKLDFKKHPCHNIAIPDNGFYEHPIYEGYRANICMGLPILTELKETHIWKMYDKEYMYPNGRILEIIKKNGNVYYCQSIVNNKRKFCVIQIDEDVFICGKNLTDAKLQLIRYSFQKTFWKTMYFGANTKVALDTAKAIFGMFKHYLKINNDVSLPIKDKYTIKEIIDLTN